MNTPEPYVRPVEVYAQATERADRRRREIRAQDLGAAVHQRTIAQIGDDATPLMDRNPYAPGSDEGVAWTDGWLDAEGSRRKARDARVAEADRTRLADGRDLVIRLADAIRDNELRTRADAARKSLEAAAVEPDSEPSARNQLRAVEYLEDRGFEVTDQGLVDARAIIAAEGRGRDCL